MKSRLIFKVKEFPTASETFVVFNIIAAIDAGYDVSILTDVVHPVSNSSQEALISKYKLMDLIQPSFEMHPSIVSSWNPDILFHFFKFCWLKRKLDHSLLWLLKFYYPFRKQTTFHVHFGSSVQPLRYLKQIGFLKSDIIVTFHGYAAHFMPNHKESPSLAEFYNSQVKKILVNSNYLKDVLIGKGILESQIDVIPIGYDQQIFNSHPKPRTSKVLQLVTVGRLIPLKGQGLGIQVVKDLVEKGVDLHYTIIGDGPQMEALQLLIREANLEAYISLAGKKSQSEIKEALANSDLFLMTSTQDQDGRREAFGVVSLEAQAMGVPVIGFDSGGFSETIRDTFTGFLVPDGNIIAMSEKVQMLLSSPALLSDMKQTAALHASQEFGPEKTTNRYLNYY